MFKNKNTRRFKPCKDLHTSRYDVIVNFVTKNTQELTIKSESFSRNRKKRMNAIFSKRKKSFIPRTQIKPDDPEPNEFSCYIFDNNHFLRVLCKKIEKSFFFQYATLIIICVHCIFLGLYDYIDRNDSNFFNDFINFAEPFFISFYSFEMVIKVISKCFIYGQKAYLKNPFNCVDFLVVVMGWLSFFDNLEFFGILRAIKMLEFLEKKNIFNRLSSSFEVIRISFVNIFMIAAFELAVLSGFSIFSMIFFSNANNFQGFTSAFESNFFICLIENWEDKLIELNDYEENFGVGLIYIFIVILVINLVLKNLIIVSMLEKYLIILKQKIVHKSVMEDKKLVNVFLSEINQKEIVFKYNIIS